MRRPEPDEPTPSGETAAPPSDLDAEVAAHQSCSCLARQHGRLPWAHCLECEHAWPCLVRRLADEVERLTAAHARCTNLSNAEAYRIFEEAREQRERAEQGEAALLRVTAERDAADATIDRLIAALDLAEGYIRAWADRGDEGANATLRMITQRRSIRG
jgi:hypothetical protein